MSDPFRTLTDHLHSNHVALVHLFERCLALVRERRPRKALLPGIRDAVTALRAHHRYEDEVLIPRVRATDDALWDQVVEEHQALSDALSTLEQATVHGPPDLSDLEQALEQIVAILPNHFQAEEDALSEATWRGIFDDNPEQARAFGKQTAAVNRAALQPAARMLPLLLYNIPPDERARFTDRMPGFLIQGLVPYAFRPAWRSRRPFMAFPPRRLVTGLLGRD